MLQRDAIEKQKLKEKAILKEAINLSFETSAGTIDLSMKGNILNLNIIYDSNIEDIGIPNEEYQMNLSSGKVVSDFPGDPARKMLSYLLLLARENPRDTKLSKLIGILS